MDCLKAQTCITSYVEEELSGDELKEFLIHMEHCSGCREELEIYYTLLVGTKQLDEGELTTSNFSKELDEKIHSQLLQIRKFDRLSKRVNFTAAFFGLFVVLWTTIKLMDLTIPILNPPTITWEQEKIFLEGHMLPYMYCPPDFTERNSKQ